MIVKLCYLLNFISRSVHRFVNYHCQSPKWNKNYQRNEGCQGRKYIKEERKGGCQGRRKGYQGREEGCQGMRDGHQGMVVR